jgi:hypothetical protein
LYSPLKAVLKRILAMRTASLTHPASDEEGQNTSLRVVQGILHPTFITPPPKKKKKTRIPHPTPSYVNGSTRSKVDREAKKRAIAADPNQGRCLLTMTTCNKYQAGELVEAAHVMARSMHPDDVSFRVLIIIFFPEHFFVVAGDPMCRLETEQAGCNAGFGG